MATSLLLPCEPDASLAEGPKEFLARATRPPGPLRPLLPPYPPLHDVRIVARGKGRSLVFIRSSEVWAFEARGRLVCVHAPTGCFDIDRSLSEVESVLGPPVLRVHRNWLVRLVKVRELRSTDGGSYLFAGDACAEQPAMRGIEAPIARERLGLVRRALLAGSFGLRERCACQSVKTLDAEGAS